MGHKYMSNEINKAIRMGVCGLVLMSAACSQGETTPSAVESSPTKVSSPHMDKNNTNVPVTGKTLNQQVAEAISDLAARSGIVAGDIIVTQARSVHWGSSALGCPQAGMNYTQAIIPGVLLILKAGKRNYRYHGRMSGGLNFCPEDRAEEPAYGPEYDFM